MKNLCFDSSISNASSSARNRSTASHGPRPMARGHGMAVGVARPRPRCRTPSTGTRGLQRRSSASTWSRRCAESSTTSGFPSPTSPGDLLRESRVGRGAAQIRDARVLRPAGLLLDVDRDDPSVAHEVEQPREVVGASAELGAGLDEDVGTKLVDQLLVEPQVERALPDRDAEGSGCSATSASPSGSRAGGTGRRPRGALAGAGRRRSRSAPRRWRGTPSPLPGSISCRSPAAPPLHRAVHQPAGALQRRAVEAPDLVRWRRERVR